MLHHLVHGQVQLCVSSEALAAYIAALPADESQSTDNRGLVKPISLLTAAISVTVQTEGPSPNGVQGLLLRGKRTEDTQACSIQKLRAISLRGDKHLPNTDLVRHEPTLRRKSSGFYSRDIR